MSRLTFTPRERLQMRGYCTGPEDGAPGGLGAVGLDRKAACCTCGKRVAVTPCGRYSNHKPWARERAWADRYMVTSVRGRVWTRSMVRAAALALGRRLGLPVEPRLVDAVLDDDEFMRRHHGEVPARVCEAVHEQARLLGYRKSARVSACPSTS